MVAAVDDDHVLGAADDVDVAARQISHVAGIEPAVGHAGVGGVGIADIAGHQRRPRAHDLADRARSEELRGGKVFVSACRYRWSRYHLKKKQKKLNKLTIN